MPPARHPVAVLTMLELKCGSVGECSIILSELYQEAILGRPIVTFEQLVPPERLTLVTCDPVGCSKWLLLLACHATGGALIVHYVPYISSVFLVVARGVSVRAGLCNVPRLPNSLGMGSQPLGIIALDVHWVTKHHHEVVTRLLMDAMLHKLLHLVVLDLDTATRSLHEALPIGGGFIHFALLSLIHELLSVELLPLVGLRAHPVPMDDHHLLG
jgi:hypothetical protein